MSMTNFVIYLIGTLLVVAGLASPDFMMEIEAIAVVE